jgi:hypothetical protein
MDLILRRAKGFVQNKLRRIWSAACPKPQHQQMQEQLEKLL